MVHYVGSDLRVLFSRAWYQSIFSFTVRPRVDNVIKRPAIRRIRFGKCVVTFYDKHVAHSGKNKCAKRHYTTRVRWLFITRRKGPERFRRFWRVRWSQGWTGRPCGRTKYRETLMTAIRKVSSKTFAASTGMYKTSPVSSPKPFCFFSLSRVI